MFGKIKTISVSALLVLAMLTGGTGCTDPDGDNGDVTTTFAASSEYSETVIEYEETDPFIVDKSLPDYKRLRDTLDGILSEKSFTDEIEMMFYDTLDRLYVNYPTWADMYRDMPSTEEYIKDNFIEAARVIHEVTFYDMDSPEAQSLLDDGEADAWMSADAAGRPYIVIMATPKARADNNTREYDLQRFYHEMTHCRTSGIVLNLDDEDNFAGNDIVSQNITEGCATFHMKFIYPMGLPHGGSWGISNGDQSISIDYSKNDCVGYLIYLNEYEKLMYLAGYEAIFKMEMGEIPLNDVKKS